MYGLNRTSVGLKHQPTRGVMASLSRLNRTSVGLKLLGSRIPNSRIAFSLNRTSVGLKLTPSGEPAPDGRMPQSNQRGIETLIHLDLDLIQIHASIEPAWD